MSNHDPGHVFYRPLEDLSRAFRSGDRNRVFSAARDVLAATHRRMPFHDEILGYFKGSKPTEPSPSQPSSPPIDPNNKPMKRRAGRHKMTVGDMTCEQWMAAEAVKDPAVTRRTGREWAAKGKWKSPRTYEQTGLFKLWKKSRSVQDTVASEQVRAEFSECSDSLGEKEKMSHMCVSPRKSSLGKPRRTAKERAHERDVEEFLAQAEPQNKPPAQ